MMLDNVKIWIRKNKNDEWFEMWKDIEVGSFSITETLSGNYECGKFNWIANSTNTDRINPLKHSKPFEPYMQMKIDIEGKVSYWLLENDRTYRKGVGVWSHEITFTEPTLLLEFITVENISFKKATGTEIVPRELNYNNLFDMVDRIREITPISPYVDNVRVLPYYFNITTELENELKKHDAFDTSYSSNNLYEVIFDIFSSFNAIPRLELDSNGEFKDLTFRRRNVKKELIDLSNGECGYESHNNATNYVSSYKGNLQNAILQNNNVVDSGWVSGKPITDDSTENLNAENYGFELESNIKKIIKVDCKLNIESTGLDYQNFTYRTNPERPIGPFNIKEKFPKLWNILDASKIFIYEDEYKLMSNQDKSNSFYYDGSTKIFSGEKNTTYGYVPITHIITMIVPDETIHIDSENSGDLSYADLVSYLYTFRYVNAGTDPKRYLWFQFKFLYIADFNINFNLIKDNYKLGNYSKEEYINQNNNIVDLDKFSSYAKDALISSGNEELQYLRITKGYENCYKLGQYNSDGFVVNQVINMQHRELWYSRMTATKDFQNANGFYKPSQTLVKYAIDKDNIFNRQCVIKDTVILDIVNDINSYSFLNDIYMTSFNFNDENKDIYFTNSSIIVKSKNGYYGNVTYNKIEFNSPILAGKSIDQDNTVKLVFYTDAYRIDGNTYTNGELIRSWFEIGKLDLSSNAIYGIKKIPQYASQKNLYPYSKLIMIDAIKFLKDPDETLSIEYQIHHLSNHPKIIVGPAFAKYNRFIANKNVNIKFFISNKIYNINDKYADEIIYEDINIGNIENNKISINSVSPFTSWGLFAEESKELFFVVNSMDIKEIYINFKLYGV